ncbi:MAG TPA: lipopolysaccharide biosynthesis protein, partial [Longimicrobiales bacterium]
LAAIVAAALLVSRNAAVVALIVLLGVMRIVESISDVYRGLMQQCERMERVAISMILRSTAALGVFTLVLLLDGTLLGAVAAMAATNLLVWWSWDVRNVGRLVRERAVPGGWTAVFGVRPRFNFAVLLAMARTALPLGIVAMLLSLNSYAPQYAIKTLAGEADLGIFAALLYAAMAPSVLIGAAGQSASPRLAKLYQAGDRKAFRTLHNQLMGFGGIVGAATMGGAMLLGKPALRIVYGADYAAHGGLLVQLSLVAAVIHLVSLQGYTVTATRCFNAQLPVSLAVAATTLLAGFLLVPLLGTRGAALAMLAGALVQGAGYSLLLRHARQRMPQPVGTEQAHAFA